MCAAPRKARRKSGPSMPGAPLIRDGCKEEYELTIIWRIENLSLLEMKENLSWNVVTSPHFATRALEKICFRLVLHTMVQRDDGKYLNVKLYTDGDWDGRDYQCELSLVSRTGSSLVKERLRDPVLKKYRSFVLLDSIKHSEVFVTRKYEFLPLDTLTVRLRLWKNKKAFNEAEFISARSRLEVAENSFRWPIELFSSLELYQEVVTPVRLGFSGASNNFFLKFSLERESLEDAGTRVVLTAVSLPVASVVSMKVSVLDNQIGKCCKAIECTSTKSEVFETGSPETWTIADFASREELLRKIRTVWKAMSSTCFARSPLFSVSILSRSITVEFHF